DDLSLARLCREQLRRDLVELRHNPLDVLDLQANLVIVHHVTQDLLGELQIDLAAIQLGVGRQFQQCSLELTNVRSDALGNELRDQGMQRYRMLRSLVLQDGDPRLQVRRLDVGAQAPAESG